jgi:hypothetical protein
MNKVDGSEVLNLLEQPPRYLGWTQEQWAIVAGQVQGRYVPSLNDARLLRMDWLRSMQTVDQSKTDPEFAARLFYNVGRTSARGFDLTDDRAKICG